MVKLRLKRKSLRCHVNPKYRTAEKIRERGTP